jgi:hypothetical protein
MTTAIPSQPLTTAAVLFNETEDNAVFLFNKTENTVDALASALHEHGVLGSLGGGLKDLSRAGRDAVSGQIATAAHGLLDLDLGDLIVGGWRKYADLTAAAKRTIATPDSTEVVDLVTHRIISTHRPRVQVLVNDVNVATLRFELCIELAVKGLVATVRHGRLVTLHSGACDVTATLAADGQQLAKREAHLELRPLLHLGGGIPLLQGAEYSVVPPVSPQPEG